MNRQHVQFRGISAAVSGQAPVRPVRIRPGSLGGSSTSASRSTSREPLHPFLIWALERAGLDPEQYRPSALNRRVSAALRVVRTTCPDSARQIVEAKPELLPQVVSAVLLGVSEFFRDPRVFEVIAQRILPELQQQRPGIRVWSAACADGRELYSVAMLLADQNCLKGSWLLGSDCRAAAIAQARAGWYPEQVLSAVPQHLRPQFLSEGNGWRLSRAIREAVHWQTADLLQSRDIGAWDLVLWRNMAIYLSPHKAADVWCRLTEALPPGGYLVTGKAERPPSGLPLARVASCVYRRIRRPGGAGHGAGMGMGRVLL